MDRGKPIRLENARLVESSQKRISGVLRRSGKMGQQTIDKSKIKFIMLVCLKILMMEIILL